MIDVFGNSGGTIITCGNETEMRLMVEVLIKEGLSLEIGSTPSRVYVGDSDEWRYSDYHNLILDDGYIDGYATDFNKLIDPQRKTATERQTVRSFAECQGRNILTFGEAIATLAKQQTITESEFDAEFDALMA